MIMPRNLNFIVHSWIRILYMLGMFLLLKFSNIFYNICWLFFRQNITQAYKQFMGANKVSNDEKPLKSLTV